MVVGPLAAFRLFAGCLQLVRRSFVVRSSFANRLFVGLQVIHWSLAGLEAVRTFAGCLPVVEFDLLVVCLFDRILFVLRFFFMAVNGRGVGVPETGPRFSSNCRRSRRDRSSGTLLIVR